MVMEADLVYLYNLFAILSGCNFVTFSYQKYSIMASKTFLVSLENNLQTFLTTNQNSFLN